MSTSSRSPSEVLALIPAEEGAGEVSSLLSSWRSVAGPERERIEARLTAVSLPALVTSAQAALGRERRGLAELVNRRSWQLAQTAGRESAELLVHLLDTDALAGLVSPDGKSCRAAASEALLAMGYPYALEIPPRALEALRREQAAGGAGRRSGWLWPVVLAALLAIGAFVLWNMR